MQRKYKPIGTGMAVSQSELGKLMREKRLGLKLSQLQAAKQSKMCQSNWSQIELGTIICTANKVLRRIAKTLQCSIRELKRSIPLTTLRYQPKTKRGRFIRSKRLKLRLTRTELAARIHKPVSYIDYLECSRREGINFNTARVLAPAINVPLASLVKFMPKYFQPIKSELGRLIREERKELFMSQTELASKLGIKKQMMSQIERGLCPLNQSDDLIEKIAAEIKIDPDKLKTARQSRKIKTTSAVTDLGNFLSNRRRKLGLTFIKISELTGINKANLGWVFRGKVYPNTLQREKIAQALQCQIPARFLAKKTK